MIVKYDVHDPEKDTKDIFKLVHRAPTSTNPGQTHIMVETANCQLCAILYPAHDGHPNQMIIIDSSNGQQLEWVIPGENEFGQRVAGFVSRTIHPKLDVGRYFLVYFCTIGPTLERARAS